MTGDHGPETGKPGHPDTDAQHEWLLHHVKFNTRDPKYAANLPGTAPATGGTPSQPGEGKPPSDPHAPGASVHRASLTGLVKRIAPATPENPERRAHLLKLATEAQAKLKDGDMEAAAAAVETLRQALQPGGEGGTAPGKPDAASARSPESPGTHAAPTAAPAGEPAPTEGSKAEPHAARTGVPTPDITGKPSAAAVDDVNKVLTDALGLAKVMVQVEILNQFRNYYDVVGEAQSKYEKKKSEDDESSANLVQIALTLPFFFGAPLLGAAVKAAVNFAGPMLAKSPQATQALAALKTGFKSDAAAEVLKSTTDKAKETISKKLVEVGGDINRTMVSYTKGLKDAVKKAGNAMTDEMQKSDTVDGVAAVLSAVRLLTPELFEADLDKHLKNFETQVAPAYAKPSEASGPQGETTRTRTVVARVRVGQATYRALVTELALSGSYAPATDYTFLKWVEMEVESAASGGDRPVEITADKVAKLPPGSPPETAAITNPSHGQPSA